MPGAITTRPRVGVPFFELSGFPDAIEAAGGRPVPLRLPPARPPGGVALVREWVSDLTQVSCAGEDLDALFLAAGDPEELAGLLVAALRLDLPAVCAPPDETPLSVALAALGLTPLSRDPARVAVTLAPGGPPAREVVENFSLANALRAGLSIGGGPDLLVHLSAIAREAGAFGFSQMVRVLTPETPVLAGVGSRWFAAHGTPGLLSALGDALHDVPTVEGRLKESLPDAPPAPGGEGSRLVFPQGRASGTEGVCRRPDGTGEVAGVCRVFVSEEEAARAVLGGEVEPSALVVVGGCGPRGGPGLLRLDRLGKALREAGLEDGVAVLTDGLPPDGVGGNWVSLVTPEAASGGIIGLLRDGDTLRIDLGEGRIRTDVPVKDLAARKPLEYPRRASAGYAARYARSALPALEGAGFG